MCLHRNCIYIEPTREVNQLECNNPTVHTDNTFQSNQTARGNYTTISTPNLTLHPVVVQSAYSKAFLLKLSDKVHVNHQYQCLPPLACQNIQQLGLCRRGKRGGKRRNRHLDIVRPCRTNPKNLVRVTIKVDISKYQQDWSLTFHYLMHNLWKIKI